MTDNSQKTSHRFLDEAGDTTFWGKKKNLMVGQQGVSLTFSIGMVKFNEPLDILRQKIRKLQTEVEQDDYYNKIPSVFKKSQRGGFFFHATDDPPEVREKFFRYIKTLNCSLEIVIARKIPSLFQRKHSGKEADFYADILSHLLKSKFTLGDRVVLNIAQRGNSTKNTNLQKAFEKAISRFLKTKKSSQIQSKIVFNVQNHRTEPLLNVADYMCWAVQRVFERGEMRFYDYLKEKIVVALDLYDFDKYDHWKNYYGPKNPLTTQNKLSPPPH